MNNLRHGDLFPLDKFGGSYTNITIDDLEYRDLGAPYQESRQPRSIHYSSERQDWETPEALFEYYNGFFQFDLDAAATMVNRKCANYFGPDHWNPDCRDCLTIPWADQRFPITAWLNSPYGRGIGRFIRKARKESEAGRAAVVCLVPARTDTRWWQEDAWQAHEIHLIMGRVRFVGAADQAPFPSAVLIFNGTGPNPAPPVVKCVEVPRG